MNINTERLLNLLGSETAVQRFVEMFHQQWPGQLSALREALAGKDWETASHEAHALKSQCRYLGLDEWADTLQQIETEPEKPVAIDHWPLSIDR